MTMTLICILAALALLLIGAVIFLNSKIKGLKTDLNFLEIDIKGQLNAGLNNLANATPRARINQNDEAVISLPDGREIYNYDLKKKK